MEPIRLIWQCLSCNDVVISYSHLVHDMNCCDCGKSAIDLEENYCRIIGKTKEISRKKFIDGRWENVKLRDSGK